MIDYVMNAIYAYVRSYKRDDFKEYFLGRLHAIIKDTGAEVELYIQDLTPFISIRVDNSSFTDTIPIDTYEILKEALYVRSE